MNCSFLELLNNFKRDVLKCNHLYHLNRTINTLEWPYTLSIYDLFFEFSGRGKKGERQRKERDQNVGSLLECKVSVSSHSYHTAKYFVQSRVRPANKK